MFIARKRSLGQGNVFTPICHSVHRRVYSSMQWGRGCLPLGPGGVCLWVWGCLPLGRGMYTTPLSRHPWADTIPGQTHPLDDHFVFQCVSISLFTRKYLLTTTGPVQTSSLSDHWAFPQHKCWSSPITIQGPLDPAPLFGSTTVTSPFYAIVI